VAVCRRVLFESSTTLYKFGTRYYDPSLGRWTQQDPVGGSLGDLNAANRYTYADDNPVNVTDPTGLSVCGWYVAAASFGLAATVLIAAGFFIPPIAPFVEPVGILFGIVAAYYWLVGVFLC
jgi:RHS repeat-associated protein